MNILFWLNTQRHKNIYCRLSEGFQRKEISTGLHVDPKHWRGTNMLAKASKGDPEEIIINQKLQRMKFKIDNIILDLEKTEKAVTPQLVYNIFKGKSISGQKPLELRVAMQIAIDKIEGITSNSIKAYQVAAMDLERFLDAETLIDTNVHETDSSISGRYLSYLRDKNNRFVTIKLKLSRIATLFDVILKELNCPKPKGNPFKIKIKKTHNEADSEILKDKWVDEGTQERIESIELDNDLNYYRKMFLFQVNTGLAWVDMMKFDPDLHIIIDIDKDKWIRLRRTKTIKSKRYSEIPFTGATKKLITFFNEHKTGVNLVNDISYTLYYRGLKKISVLLGIESITSHMARHTFGVRMLESGLSMESVSHMMGHASISMTESIYAKVTKRKLKMDIEKARLSI